MLCKEANSKKAIFLSVFLAFLIFFHAGFFFSLPVRAEPKKNESKRWARGKVVVFIIDRVGITDSKGRMLCPSRDTPFLWELSSKWSFGLMVSRSLDPPSIQDFDLGGGYLTCGAGIRLRGTKDSGFNFSIDEKVLGKVTALDYYKRYSGKSPRGDSILSLRWQEIINANERDSKKYIGYLGTLLSENSKAVAVVGNSDTYRGPSRLGALLCLKEDGTCDKGEVNSSLIVKDSLKPGGYINNEQKIFERTLEYLRTSDLVVVDTGDTARVDREYSVSSISWEDVEKREALRRADDLIRRIANELDLNSSLLIVISPTPPRSSVKDGNYLTPIFAAGPRFSRGLLTSDSTRRRGIVNNTDILATILAFFGIETPGNSVSLPIRSIRSNEMWPKSADSLFKMANQLDITMRARWPILICYCILILLFAILTIVTLLPQHFSFVKGMRLHSSPAILCPLSLVLLSTPISFLLISLFRYKSITFPVLFTTFFSIALGLFSWFGIRKIRIVDPAAFILLITVGIIVVDLASGERLSLLPLLGASALEGFRFFGLTNAIAALLISSSIWLAVFILSGKAKRNFAWHAVSIFFTLVAIIIGIGRMGANLGGFIAASATFLIFTYANSRKEFNLKSIATIASFILIGTAFIVLLDFLFFHAHAGRLVQSGFSRFLPIVRGKVSIHIGEIGVFPIPSVLLIFSAIGLAFWLRKPSGFPKNFFERYPLEAGACFSTLVGGLFAFVFNDSGIAMLGIMVLVGTLAISYRALSVFLAKSSNKGLKSSINPAL